MLKDKTVLLGVCACTPAYKALDLIGMLKIPVIDEVTTEKLETRDSE